MSSWYDDWERDKEDRVEAFLYSIPDFHIIVLSNVSKCVKFGDRTYDLIQEENFEYFVVGDQKYIIYAKDSNVSEVRLTFKSGMFLRFRGNLSRINDVLQSAGENFSVKYIGDTPNKSSMILTVTSAPVQLDVFGTSAPNPDLDKYDPIVSYVQGDSDALTTAADTNEKQPFQLELFIET